MFWFAAISSVIGMIWSLKNLLFIEKYVDSEMFNALYDLSRNKPKFIFEEKISCFEKYPLAYAGFGIVDRLPYFIRMETAEKARTVKLIGLRWHGKKLDKFLRVDLLKIQKENFGVPVSISDTYWNRSLGYLKKTEYYNIHGNIFEDFEKDVENILEEKLDKTGLILYGPPGTGKTSYIRKLALKYHLPIQIMTFEPNMSNTDVLCRFSNIRTKSIVLMEDFDNIFNKRQCIIGENGGSGNQNIKLTFDSVLNGLDGIFNTYDGAVFIITCNDLDKIDDAIKNRPSRVKFKIKMDVPSHEIKKKFLQEWCDITPHINVDQLMKLSEFKKSGLPIQKALYNLGLGLETMKEELSA